MAKKTSHRCVLDGARVYRAKRVKGPHLGVLVRLLGQHASDFVSLPCMDRLFVE